MRIPLPPGQGFEIKEKKKKEKKRKNGEKLLPEERSRKRPGKGRSTEEQNHYFVVLPPLWIIGSKKCRLLEIGVSQSITGMTEIVSC